MKEYIEKATYRKGENITNCIWQGIQCSSVQSLSRVWLFATPWTAAGQASLSITNSRRLPKLMSTELVMSSNHLIICCPLLLLPSIFPSIRVDEGKRETMETVADFIFWGSKITADGDCIREIKRHLLLGRKAITNLASILKSRDITLSTKVHPVKAMIFPPVVMYECESWTIKNAEHWRIDAFELWC